MKKPFQLRFEVKSDFGYLPFLTRLFHVSRFPKAGALTQILVESFNNAVTHAHHSKKGKWIGIDIRISPRNARLRVTDRGRGIRELRTAPRGKREGGWKTRGRGLTLIRALASRVKSVRNGKSHVLEAVCNYE